MPSLTPAKTLKEWRALAGKGRVRALPTDGCAPLRALFYAGTDWLRLSTKLAGAASPCAHYYISVPPLVGDKTQPRGDQAWRIRALGPNFHAASEIHYGAWSNWVNANGSTFFAAGVEARRRMALMGYDVSQGDTWVVNEATSAVRQNGGNARTNVREFVRGLHTGDGTAPTKGGVFITGMNQSTGELSVYQARLQDWLADASFWNDMRAYVSDWSQELYGDVRNYAVPGTTLEERRVALDEYLQHELTLARVGPATEARAYLEETYNPLANAAWAYDAAFGWTAVDVTQMQHYVSAQVEALRTFRPEASVDRFGFAWSPKNLTAMPDEEYTAQTEQLLERLAAAIRDSGSTPAAACGTWCGGELAGAAFNHGWKTFGAWKPSILAFATPEQTVRAGVATSPASIELRTHSGVPFTTGQPMPVTLRSTSASGAFSTAATGPWSATLTTPMAAGTSSLTFYYRDTSIGTPVLTASAADRVETSQAQTVTANASVASVTWWRSGSTVYARPALVDGAGAPLGAASVSASVARNDYAFATRAGTTSADGRVTFSFWKPGSGCYTLTVTGVGAPGWDGATPANRFCM